MSHEMRQTKTENRGPELRRICCKQVELALDIAKGTKRTDGSPIHETRKHLKKARAALRLLQAELGCDLFKRNDHRLRDVGRIISEVRDAEVRLQTVRQLQDLMEPRKQGNYQGIEEGLAFEL